MMTDGLLSSEKPLNGESDLAGYIHYSSASASFNKMLLSRASLLSLFLLLTGARANPVSIGEWISCLFGPTRTITYDQNIFVHTYFPLSKDTGDSVVRMICSEGPYEDKIMPSFVGRVEVECAAGSGLVEFDFSNGKRSATPELHARGKFVGNGGNDYHISCV
ncbi:hypothetical protein BDZ90DRAFT_257099 [Jaminaea rosea]|uniref:Uncharacterized protein n=1 Tax=Jaminaea rosea TaxID=1569628 RepID=A0A316UXF9_9BASI|nr:hypothetical protein BDZ90DRAFT_257099 [Jaminaea rosea]PWN29990.1 hypothetical protein BDZ90DRAFT_257099 [Jaminaea rosea]